MGLKTLWEIGEQFRYLQICFQKSERGVRKCLHVVKGYTPYFQTLVCSTGVVIYVGYIDKDVYTILSQNIISVLTYIAVLNHLGTDQAYM